MKRIKKQEGITLVTLVVTILILTILAFVVIQSINDNEIIKYADEASLKYSESVKNETISMGDFENTITSVPNASIGNLNVAVGTTIKGYDATKNENGNSTGVSKNVEWKLLGKNSNGQIILVSATNVQNNVTMNSYEDFENGGNKLHTICSVYGHGKYAQSARSVIMSDITKETKGILYKNTSGSSSYWLPNQYVYSYGDGNDNDLGLYVVKDGNMSHTIFANDGDGSPYGWEESGHGARAVVVLKENVTIDSNGNLSYNK